MSTGDGIAPPAADEIINRDVVVVGYGSAGAVAALEASRQGADVLLVEKMPFPGGNSVLSAGYMRVADDASAAAAYLDATCGGRVEQQVLQTLAQGMTELVDYLEELAAPAGARVFRNVGSSQTADDVSDLYDWPGREAFGWAGIESVPGFDRYSWAQVGGRGQNLLRVLETNLDESGVEIRLAAPVRSLVIEDEAVRGVELEQDGRSVRVLATGGVVLACGGFEFDERLLTDHSEIPEIHGIGWRGNTGDGIRLSQQAGASLWHMWHHHGSYGFKFADFDVAFRNHLGGARRSQRGVAWILVDQNGRRFTNELPPAPQDTPVRSFAHLDSETGRFDRIPAWMIFDDQARRLGPVGKQVATTPGQRYEWSQDNSAEIERGWILRTESLSELAAATGLPAAALTETVDQWNRDTVAGRDPEFARPGQSMVPVATPPFHAVRVVPVVTNTQGGPVHDEHQQVIDFSGRPVPGLYAVGELGSVFGHIYLLGGNLAECLIGGRIAGRRAAGGLDR